MFDFFIWHYSFRYSQLFNEVVATNPLPCHTPNGNHPVCVEEKSTLQSRNPNSLTIIVQERAPATHTICNQFSPIGVRPCSEKNNSELTNPILVRISNRKTNHSKSLIKIGHQRKQTHRSNLINIHLIDQTTKNTINTNRKDRTNVFLSNVRSLLPKIDVLQTTFELHGVDLAFITETWLNENIDDAAVELPN